MIAIKIDLGRIPQAPLAKMKARFNVENVGLSLMAAS